MFANLSFEEKILVCEEVLRRYPQSYLESRFPEYGGEVPFSWFMSERELEEIIQQYVFQQTIGFYNL